MSSQFNIAVSALDDNEDDLYFIRGLLQQLGVLNYNLFHINEDFINHLDDNIHVIILDHNLGGPMTGLDILKIIRSKNPYSFVIFSSAIDLPKKTIYEYVNLGINKWVDKNEPDYHALLKECIMYGLSTASYKAEAFTYFKNKHDHDTRSPVPN